MDNRTSSSTSRAAKKTASKIKRDPDAAKSVNCKNLAVQASIQVEETPELLANALTEDNQLRNALKNKDIQISVLTEKVFQLETMLANKTEVLGRDPQPTTIKAEEVMRRPNGSKSKTGDRVLRSADDVPQIVLEALREQFGIHWSEISEVFRKCRLVCKAWRNSADRFLEQDLSHMKLCSTHLSLIEYRQDYSPVSTHLSSKLPEEEAERIQSFMNFCSSQQKRQSTYNPLPNQHLFIECHREPRNTEDVTVARNWIIFSEAVEQYLQMFGKTVRALTLVIDMPEWILPRKQINLLPMYRSFCEWLHLLPELQSLALVTCSDYPTYTQKRKRHSLNALLTFPTLKNLLIFQSTQLSNFAYSLLKQNGQIQKLYLGDSTWPTENSSLLEHINLPNLLECTLHIDRRTQKPFMETNETWNLEKLTVGFHGRKLPDAVLYVPYTSTVVDLTLEERNINDCKNLRLDEQVVEAPRLKQLTLKSLNWENIDWHSFLAGVPLVEEINVEMSTKTEPREQGFLEYVLSIVNGAYWCFLPHLECISFVLRKEEITEPLPTINQRLHLERAGMPPLQFNITVKGTEK